MSLDAINLFAVCAGAFALVCALVCLVSAIAYRRRPEPPAEEAPKPRPVRMRVRSYQIVPKSEAHTLPRYLKKH